MLLWLGSERRAWRLQPCSTATALPKMKSTVPLATAVPSRAGHVGGGVELFKLDSKDDLWVSSYCSDGLWISSYCSDGLWFSSAPFRCVCCGGGIICARIDGLQ